MGRQATGVKAIRLKPRDQVISMIVVGAEDKYIFTASEKGYGKKTEINQYPRHRRGGQGFRPRYPGSQDHSPGR
jgi:DNA gyrase subunit A